MTSPISRRRFLRDSAIVSGGVLLVDFGAASAASGAAPSADDGAAASDGGGGTSDGRFAEIDYGEPNGDFLVQWTCTSGNSSMQLTNTSVRIDVPIWGASEMDLADFEQGRAEYEIQQNFGPAALEQLRNEVRNLRLFSTS